MEEPPSHTLIIIVHIGSSHSQANMEYWDISPGPAGQHWTAWNIVFYGEKVDCDCDCEIAATKTLCCTAHYVPQLTGQSLANTH